jgi:hypothetical protein
MSNFQTFWKEQKRAIYDVRAQTLFWDTGKEHSNGVMTFGQVKNKYFATEEDARKYVIRYLPTHSYTVRN